MYVTVYFRIQRAPGITERSYAMSENIRLTAAPYIMPSPTYEIESGVSMND